MRLAISSFVNRFPRDCFTSLQKEKLYHISEAGNIQAFIPRPSPSIFKGLEGDVVFAITEKLLHHYLLPRDCPRVCYYANPQTTQEDKKLFLKSSKAFFMAIEADWSNRIKTTTLYCYELPSQSFNLLDECAGYYISHQPVIPVATTIITNPLESLLAKNNLELQVLPTLWDLANKVANSSLSFSLIRMRNAQRTNNQV